MVSICSHQGSQAEVAGPTAQKSILLPNPSHLVPHPPNLPLSHHRRCILTLEECLREGTKMASQKYEEKAVAGGPLRGRGQSRETPVHLALSSWQGNATQTL